MEEQKITLETAKLALEKGFNCLKVMNDFPTQSLLQKWLREVHKIHIDIQQWEFENWYFYLKDGRISPVKSIRIDVNDNVKWEFNTYEEALEQGLQEALKLI